MKNYKLLLVLFFITNSCSKEDETGFLNDTILSLQKNISELNTTIDNYISQVNQLSNENSQLSNQISDLQSQNNSLVNEKINLQDDINSLVSQNSYLQEQIDELSSQKMNLDEQINNLSSENNDYKEQIDELSTQKISLQQQIDTLTIENQTLNSQLQSYIDEIYLITEDYNQSQNQNNTLSDQVSNLTTINEDLNSQVGSLNVQLNDLQSQIQEYIDQIQELSNSNQISEIEKNDLTNELKELQDELNNLASETNQNGLYIFNKIEFSAPPFYGTVWDLPNIIDSSNFTVYSSSTYIGIETRLFYDKSISDFIVYPAHIYNINFGDGISLEFEIKTDFTREEADIIEEKYSPLLGQLGKDLRKNIKTMEFLKGNYTASAQYSTDLTYANITFHTDWFENEVETRPDGNKTEEVFIHEATHLSIDPYVYGDPAWNVAVNLDGNYISTYAYNNPNSEDIAETFPAYIAVKYFPDRISSGLKDTILSLNFNRFKYFDSLNLDLSIYE